MGAVVIHDQLYVQIGRDGFVDGVEELAELNGPMAPMTFPDHFDGFRIQRCKQGGRPVAFVIVASPLRLSGAHRQHGL